MRSARVAKWIGATILGLVALVLLVALLFDPNWLRGPIMRTATEKTGRELVINGDLGIDWGWPVTRLSAGGVTFANPSWAEEPQMLEAENITVGVSLPQLLKRRIVLPVITLDRADVFLEQHPDGRKNWLLDREQKNEESSVAIGRLALHDGRIRYADSAQETRIEAKVTTTGDPDAAKDGTGVDGNNVPRDGVKFSAKGRYKGMPLTVRGSGGPVLALRDDDTPYPLQVDASIGKTRVKAEGRITSLLKLSAIDLDVDLRGDSLGKLFPLIGIALPATPPYRTSGRIVREGATWRYEKFSGAIGSSDVNGTLQVDTGGERPYLHGELAFKVLDLADLGPVIGAEPEAPPAARESAPTQQPATAAAARKQVLPETPFRTDRWNSVDADVKLRAGTIRRPEALPIEDLATRLQMRDSVLTLDPLEFGVADGTLAGMIRLNGRDEPLAASARLRIRRIKLGELFPTLDVAKSSIGEFNGDFDLNGRGDSVARMLGTADGKLSMILVRGEISRLMMETIGLHLWEMLKFKLGGDQLVHVRCAIADFAVNKGVMHTNVLVFDTDVTRITGSGTIDLANEKLDLTLKPDTKITSPIALQSPIYIRGTFANPKPSIDAGEVAARGLGAAALGLINPLLALIPLIETGPGMDSDCGRLIREVETSDKK